MPIDQQPAVHRCEPLQCSRGARDDGAICRGNQRRRVCVAGLIKQMDGEIEGMGAAARMQWMFRSCDAAALPLLVLHFFGAKSRSRCRPV